MAKKRKLLVSLIFAFAVLIFANPKQALAGHCGDSVDDCGCNTEKCDHSMVCYYYAPWDYCIGHSFGDTWTYLSTTATCTEPGTEHWRGYCSKCQLWYELYMSVDPAGHSMGSWSVYSDSEHVKSCSKCDYTMYNYHDMGNWYTGSDGYSYRDCDDCSYQESRDNVAPSIGSFSATPNSWSSGYGYVSFSAQDSVSGISSISLYRTNVNTGSTSCVDSWSYNGTTSTVYGSYTETSEGIYYYFLSVSDASGNTSTDTSSTIYLDHTAPSLSGYGGTYTWTNSAPTVSGSASDSISGMDSVTIYNEWNYAMDSGTSSASYTLSSSYEGWYSWRIVAEDNVGNTTSCTVSTKYDITKPYISGNDGVLLRPGTSNISGYVKDNLISQSIDDFKSRSSNSPNDTSGLKSVIIYRYYDSGSDVIYGDTTKKVFNSSSSNNSFNLYYQIPENEKKVKYYLIIAEDFAGNQTRKKIVSKQSLLTWFRTSIDKSSYK